MKSDSCYAEERSISVNAMRVADAQTLKKTKLLFHAHNRRF